MRPHEIAEEVKKSHGAIRPSPADVHVSRPLTNMSIAYMQGADKFIADQVFPNIPVMKKEDQFWAYDRDAFLRSEMEERAPGTETPAAEYMVSRGRYECKVYGLHKDITDQERANEDAPLRADRDTTEFLTLKGLLRRERDFHSEAWKASAWTFGMDGTASTRSASLNFADASNNDVIQWDNASAQPVLDVRIAATQMQSRTGFRPNTLVLGRELYDGLIESPTIIARLDRGQTSGPAMATKDALARLFELDRVIVAESIETLASINEGQDYNEFDSDLEPTSNSTRHQNFVFSGKDGLLIYRPSSAGLKVPSAGYTFSWNGYIGAGAMGNRMLSYRMQHLASDRREIEMAYEIRRISPDLGIYLNDMVGTN